MRRATIGKKERLVVTARDITERKKAEEALRESENRLRVILESIQTGILIVDPETHRIVYVNPIALKLIGASKQETVGSVCHEFICPAEKGRCPVTDLGQALDNSERVLLTAGGERRSILKTVENVTLGGRTHLLESFIDITERKLAEDSLRDNKARLDLALKSARMGAWHWDIVENRRYFDDQVCRLLGIEPATFTGSARELFSAVHPDDRETIATALERTMEQDVPYESDYRAVWPDGSIHHIASRARLVRDDVGKPVKLYGIIWDITSRKQAEETLRESEETLRALINAARESLLLIDRSGTILVANEIVAQRLGGAVDNLIGTCLYDHFSPDVAAYRKEIFDRVATTGESVCFTDARKGKVYETYAYPVFAPGNGLVSRLAIFVHDITQRTQAQEETTRLESQLRQSQKMEAIGTLAGGIAHDFNNILTTIIGYGSLLQTGMENDPKRPYVDQILTSSQKAAILTQSLLAFSRKQAIDLKPRMINEIIRQAEELLKMLLTEDIEFTVIAANPDMTIEADVTQMDQVLMNLATNARDAMPKGGKLTIETKTVHLGKDFVQAHGGEEPGDYALISIADTGMGMDQETRRKIFEPFFTTKEVGKGTGLGLSIVYGIVKQHNGYITVSSEPHSGTRFNVYLPISKTQAGPAMKPTKV